ncbi:hypothetical protein KJ840_05345 [Patescibacteria group bacterium]|nr:hypothetical protein [Patescibacteria group bacterium]
MKTKIKIFFIIALVLLFLMTSFGQAKAATYYENSSKIVKGLNEYLCRPVVDLVFFTGRNLIRIFSHRPFLSQSLLADYNSGMAYVSKKVEQGLGTFFYQAGKRLAAAPNNLPRLEKVKTSWNNFFSRAEKEINESLITSADFLEETFKNWNASAEQKIYPYTQQLITRAENNLESNFHKMLNVSAVRTAVPLNFYALSK